MNRWLWFYLILWVIAITALYVGIATAVIRLLVVLLRNPCLEGCLP